MYYRDPSDPEQIAKDYTISVINAVLSHRQMFICTEQISNRLCSGWDINYKAHLESKLNGLVQIQDHCIVQDQKNRWLMQFNSKVATLNITGLLTQWEVDHLPHGTMICVREPHSQWTVPLNGHIEDVANQQNCYFNPKHKPVTLDNVGKEHHHQRVKLWGRH